MIFENSLKPFQCILTHIERDCIPEYSSGDRYGFPSHMFYRIRDGRLSLLHPFDLDKISDNMENARHFILTNDYEQTYLLDCDPYQYEITRERWSSQYKCDIRFAVRNVGKRSLPIPE